MGGLSIELVIQVDSDLMRVAEGWVTVHGGGLIDNLDHI